MSDPILSQFTYPLICSCDRNPTSDESTLPNGFSDLFFLWVNSTTNEYWTCSDSTASAMVWKRIVPGTINSARNYTTVSSPAFSTPITPNAGGDTDVVAILSLTSTIFVSASVSAEIDGGGGYVERGRVGQSSLAGTNIHTLSFKVPANSSYQLVNTGTASIIKISELPSV